MTTLLRPTTPDDVLAFLGRPFPYRVRALTGIVDGEIKGIGGIAFLHDGTAVAFLHLSEDAPRYKVSLHKAALHVLRDAKRRGLKRIVARADITNYPGAERWLGRLGFSPLTVDGQRVLIWQN